MHIVFVMHIVLRPIQIYTGHVQFPNLEEFKTNASHGSRKNMSEVAPCIGKGSGNRLE